MSFIEVASRGFLRPRAAFRALGMQTRPMHGLLAVLTRFVVTSLTTISALHRLDVRPFAPSYLTCLDAADYYAAERYFMPLFGLASWLLMSAIAACLLAFGARRVDFARVLNVFGIGMLIPMPVVWAWDWAMIALGWYSVGVMAVSHLLFQLWETCLQTIGMHVVIGTRLPAAAAIALGANSVYILLAMLFVR